MADERTERSSGPMVCVAVVAAPHGVRGALRLRTFTEAPEGDVAYGPVYDKAGRRLFELRLIGQSKTGVIAKAEGIGDRTEAERWRGVELYVPRAALPEPLDEDEFYIDDLRGLAVERPDGARIGRVVGLDNFGAGDVIEVALDRGGSAVLPFTREVVPVVDLENGRVVVEPPAELLSSPPDDEEEGEERP
jgi:16S rRNA processing protein RimM